MEAVELACGEEGKFNFIGTIAHGFIGTIAHGISIATPRTPKGHALGGSTYSPR